MSQAVLWVLASTWRPCRLFLLFRLYVARNGVVRDVLTHRWSAFWQNSNGHVDLNFQQYSAGDVLSDLGNGVHIRAIKKDRATKKWIPGQAMVFDSAFPTGQDVSQPHMIYEGKWQWELDSLKNSLLRPCRTIWEHQTYVTTLDNIECSRAYRNCPTGGIRWTRHRKSWRIWARCQHHGIR